MKFLLTIALLCCATTMMAQQTLKYTGKHFFAVYVNNVDSASAWYQRVFDMKVVKVVELPDENVHVRILSNDFLAAEIMEIKNKKSGNVDTENFRLVYFKIGFFVKDIAAAEQYFISRKVKIKYRPFTDEATKSTSFIIEGYNGALIHILEENK